MHEDSDDDIFALIGARADIAASPAPLDVVISEADAIVEAPLPDAAIVEAPLEPLEVGGYRKTTMGLGTWLHSIWYRKWYARRGRQILYGAGLCQSGMG